MRAKAIHIRYWYQDRTREDLWDLAKCNNINGPVYDDAHLTDDPSLATCGRCRRIVGEAIVDTSRRRRFSSPFIGQQVRLLPMDKASRKFARQHGDIVILLKWDGETMTVAMDGEQATFGPHEACWQEIRT